jgi:hypothetical protein
MELSIIDTKREPKGKSIKNLCVGAIWLRDEEEMIGNFGRER